MFAEEWNKRGKEKSSCRKAKERKKESVGYMRIASGEQILFIDRSREKNVILLKSLNGRASQGTSSGYVDDYDDKRNCHLNVLSRIVSNSSLGAIRSSRTSGIEEVECAEYV